VARIAKKYLRARERIAQKVADGRMVISYEEMTDEEWEALDQMLREAGLDPFPERVTKSVH
jgi:hypothetical protein